MSLGAVCYRLTLAHANDCNTHFRRLERLADDASKKTYVRKENQAGLFRLKRMQSDGRVWAEQETVGRKPRGLKAAVIFPWNATEWRIDGEGPVLQGVELPYRPFYEALHDGLAPIVVENLSRSDSYICLAGRAGGELASRAMLDAYRFRSNGKVADLVQLLSVHGGSGEAVSRVTFFNTRTGQFDRGPESPSLVVADGDRSFLKVAASDKFKNSDIVGVVSRAVERDRLESVGNQLAELAQWYGQDADRFEKLGYAPPGIGFSVLKRR